MFTPCEIIKTAFGTDNDVLIRYISENLGGVIPEQYQQNENRIAKTNGKDADDDNEDNAIRLYHKKSGGGLSGGAIAAIVIATVVAVALLIAAIYFLKARNINKSPNTESQNTVDKMESSEKMKG